MNILITGGASGLGEVITKSLASNASNKVYFTFGKSKIKAQTLETEFRNVVAIPCNFEEQDSIKRLTNKMGEIDLDILIHNAYCGDYLKTHFHKIDSNDFLNDFKNNILPIVEITQTAINIFRKRKGGKIITILSAALIGVPPIGSSVYVANKAYLEKLTKVWACENSKFNITSNSISPSFMQTALTQNTDERLVDQIRESHPLKKLLTTLEVSETVLVLIQASNHLNGVDIPMNAATSIK